MKKREKSPEVRKLRHLNKAIKKSKSKNQSVTHLVRKLGAEIKEIRLEKSNE